MSELAAELASLLDQPLNRCQVALSRTKNNREEATDYLLTHQDESGEFWDEPTATQFARWGENLAQVDGNTLSEIVAACIESGQSFIDPSFPPEEKSLFFDPKSARKSWRCHDCNKSNPMPPESDMEQYRKYNPSKEEIQRFFQFIAQTNPLMAVQLQANPSQAVQLIVASMGGEGGPPPPLRCKFCRGQFPLGILEAKPSRWLRPKDIMDDVTVQYGAGAPWKLIRDSVRPDDVGQGAVGNCWFVGALSILAHQKPHLVASLFPCEQEYSEYGAYLVRLCKDGLWRNVIIDDQLPCNRNDALAYTNAARRQLWVPLIEKATAKLFGCYEGMHSGTLCEAFSLLTGYATDRELIKTEISDEDSDVLWARVVSGHSEGYLIGLACAQKLGSGDQSAPTLSSKDLHEAGLQAPHAYVVLDTLELARSGEKLLFLGNPWGERSPTTWKGKWGNHSPEYKEGIRSKLIPLNPHQVVSNGQFWISWTDLLKHFASIEFCRVSDKDLKHEQRVRGWLPAVTGLGDIFEIETGTSPSGMVRVDLSLYQESHAVRESAAGTGSTSVDLGLVIIKSDTGACVATSERRFQPELSKEILLEQESKFRLVPLSFSNIWIEDHRKVVVSMRCGSEKAVNNLRRVPNEAGILKEAVESYCKFSSHLTTRQELFPGLTYCITKDSAGAIVRCENATTCMFTEVSVDADDSVNMSSSRGSLITRDTIPPCRSITVMVLTPRASSNRYTLAVSVAAGMNPSCMDGSYFPPLRMDEESPHILSIHDSSKIPTGERIKLKELISRTTDAEAMPLLMGLLIKQQQDIQRLYQEYVNAGISPDEARTIAEEESDAIYQ